MQVTPQQLQKQIKSSDLPLLVEFWASWCPPCQVMKPMLEDLAQEIEGKARMLKVNLDRNSEATELYHIEGAPTFILFKNGKEIKRLVGAQSKQTLKTLLT